MEKYVVIMKGPGIGAVVALNVKQTYTYKDSERHKRLHESAERKLKNLTGKDPSWDKVNNLFNVEMTEEQAVEMRNWIGVKEVVLLEEYKERS